MIDGVKTKRLKVIPDERGLLMEILRDDDDFFQKFGQVYLSVVYPGVVKGWHYHRKQTDHFAFVKGMAKVVLYDSREGSKTRGEVNEFFLGENNPTLLVIPPLVLHGMKGIGTEPAYLINVPTEHYVYEEPDEHRVPPHSPDVPYDWNRRMADLGAPALDGARILVTGGAGFIGSSFCHHVHRRFPTAHLVVLDALTYAGRRENLAGIPERSLTFIHGDIRDPAAVARAMAGCDLVLNFAAESHVDRSIEAPGEFIQTDVYGVFVLCEEARRQQVRRFVQISTDEVYGEVLEGHATESWPLMPRSPYAASKAGGDRLAYAYHATYALPVVVTRASNNYGPRQYPEKLISLFVTNAIDDEPLPVYGSGLNRRDWLHVEDHCAALVAVLQHPGIEGETFNVGAQHEFDVLTITDTILRLLGKPNTLIRHVEDRPGHDRRYALDSSKLTRATGWKPAVGFDEGIRQTVEWYRDHTSWWRPIKDGEFRAYYERMYGQRRVLKEAGA